MNRFDHTISIVTEREQPDCRAPRRRSCRCATIRRPPAATRRAPLPLRRARHLGARRRRVRELPHLRRLRQPGVGSRRSVRRDRSPNPNPFRVGSPARSVPSPEGPDDDAEPARHGRRRPDALARRPHAAAPIGGDPLDEDLAFKEFNPAFVGLLGRGSELAPRRDAGLHRLHPDGRAIRRTRSARSTTSARPRRALGRELLPQHTDGRRRHHLRLLPPRCRSARDGLLVVRGRAAGVQDRRTCATSTRRSACSVSPGSPTPATRCAASASCTTAPSPRVFNFLTATVFQNLDADTQRRDLEAFMLALRHRPAARRRPAGLGDPGDASTTPT